MTKPLTFTQATVVRAIAAAEKAGLTVTGIRPDGTLEVRRVQSGENAAPQVSPSAMPGQIAPVPRSKWEDKH